MKTTFAALAFAASVMAKPMPQTTTPEACSESHSGTFQVTVVNVTSSAKRHVGKRQLSGILTLTLTDGVLKDQAGRTGYIASNYQWQFDNPPQENAISTSGYSYCQNNTLALAGSAIWYQCYSGGFYNIYNRHWAAQCNPIYLAAINQASGTPAASQLSDGQPQATTAVPISQITDGQPQATTALTAIPVSQLTDGQPQAPTGNPISQISDGQPQAPATTSAPYPIVTSGVPLSQITDAQVQATGTGAGNVTVTASIPAEFTGAAATAAYGVGALAAGLMGVVAML